jgi:hypothetical protein
MKSKKIKDKSHKIKVVVLIDPDPFRGKNGFYFCLYTFVFYLKQNLFAIHNHWKVFTICHKDHFSIWRC